MAKKAELVKFNSTAYPVLTEGMGDIAELFSVNLGTEGLSPFDLGRACLSGGKTPGFVIEDGDGEPETVTTIDALIVGQQDTRQMYLTSDANGEPPDCYSIDNITGNGKRSKDQSVASALNCCDCELSKFGSAVKGNGQFCSARCLVFYLSENSSIPDMISLTPTSLKNWKQYKVRLLKKRIPLFGTITQLSTESDKSVDGVIYQKTKFKSTLILDPPSLAGARSYFKMFSKVIKTTANAVSDAPANPEADTDTPE